MKHKKQISGYLTISLPISVVVDAEDVEYDYYIDFDENYEIRKKVYHPHTEEEYETSIDTILDQHPSIKEFVKNHKYEEIKFEEE